MITHKKKVLLAHPGTQHSHNLAMQLYQNQVLYKFCTGIVFGKNCWQYRLIKAMPGFISRKIANRIIEGLPDNFIKRNILLDLKYIFIIKWAKMKELAIYKRNKEFQLQIDDIDLLNSDIVIGFDTSSWILAERTNYLNRIFVLDQTIGHPLSKQKIYSVLREKYLDWNVQELVPKIDSFIDIEHREHKLANIIVTPSAFVRQSLIQNGIEDSKIWTIPFGTNMNEFHNLNRRDYQEKHLKFLFVGSVSARKGIPDLLRVWKEIPIHSAELIIIGNNNLSKEIKFNLKSNNIKFLGKKLKRDLPFYYNDAHIFLFPSYFEGLAQVQIEALCCGLPVIGTKNSGAEDIVKDGYNGFILEPGDLLGLKERIIWMINNRKNLQLMSERAEQSAKNYSWENYGMKWCNFMDNL